MTFPPNPDLARVCKSQEYKNFVDSINREYQVTITPMVRSPAAGQNIELVEGFKLNCLQSAKESTTTVKEMLDQFFVTHNVHMYPVAPTRVHKRGDSFADAFPHFDSKLLSHPRTRGGLCLSSPPVPTLNQPLGRLCGLWTTSRQRICGKEVAPCQLLSERQGVVRQLSSDVQLFDRR